jgi:hypothetical protein
LGSGPSGEPAVFVRLGFEAGHPVNEEHVACSARGNADVIDEDSFGQFHGVEACSLVERKGDGVGRSFGTVGRHGHQSAKIADFVDGYVEEKRERVREKSKKRKEPCQWGIM